MSLNDPGIGIPEAVQNELYAVVEEGSLLMMMICVGARKEIITMVMTDLLTWKGTEME